MIQRMRRVVVGCITVVVVLTIQPLVRIVTITAQQPTTTTTATPPPLSTKYLLIGVSGGLQDGFPERSKMDYVQYDDVTNTTITITPAIFIGKALIRGYKAFLDVMESGYRQYVDEPNQPLINSNVFASGCYEHANEYWFYMIDERQVLFVLNHEPRFLSITPDTGLIDLHIIPGTSRSSSVLPPSLIESYQPVHTFIEQYLYQLQVQTPERNIDTRYVAVPLVTAVYFNPSSHVPSPILHRLSDGTEITNYPDSLSKWAQVNSSDRTALYDSGCTMEYTSNTCTEEVKEMALLAEHRFWHGIRIAIRQAELQRLLKQQLWQNIVHPQTFWQNICRAIQKRFQKKNVEESMSYLPSSGIPNFQCRRQTRFGAGPNTVRINTPFTLPQITNLLSTMDYKIDITNKRIVASTTEIPDTRASSKSEL